jgi:hypothetical protein
VRAEEADEAEEQLMLFLAERLRRRARMPANAIAWEDGNELNEGLATYVEWRAHDLWGKQGVGAPLAAALPKLATRSFYSRVLFALGDFVARDVAWQAATIVAAGQDPSHG